MAKTMDSPSPTSPKSRLAKNQPTAEEIAVRAYQIYLERGGAPGNEFEDWIRAERELNSETGKLPAENGKPRRKVTVKSAAA